MAGQALVIVREPRALPMNIGHQRTVALLGHQFASSSLDGGDRGTDVFLRYVVSNHDIVPSRMDRWDAALPSASVGVNQFRTVEKTKPRCEGPAPSESRIWSRFAPLIRFHCSTVGGVRQDVFRGGEEKGGVGGWGSKSQSDAQRSSIGTTGRSSGPMYSADGRINRLSVRCSNTCAAHPAVRANTNSGVNIAVGIPIAE